MDNLGCTADERSAVLVFAFLQVDCIDLNYSKELDSKKKDLLSRTVLFYDEPKHDNGELETDGHLPDNIRVFLGDILPQIPQLLDGQLEQENIQLVAQELREIAAQFELELMARATQNLSRNMSNSLSEQLKHLTNEVENLMRRGVGLEHLPEERVIMALTLTLVKGVIVESPQLLRSLFDTAVLFIRSIWR